MIRPVSVADSASAPTAAGAITMPAACQESRGNSTASGTAVAVAVARASVAGGAPASGSAGAGGAEQAPVVAVRMAQPTKRRQRPDEGSGFGTGFVTRASFRQGKPQGTRHGNG